MKILRWLLGHSLLILLVVVVIYSYMFWGNLAGENTPAGKAIAYLSNEFEGVEEFVNAVKAKQAQLAGKEPPGQQVAEINELNEADESTDIDRPAQATEVIATQTIATQTIATEAVNRSIEQRPVSTSYRYNQMQVKQNSTGFIESETNRQAPPPVNKTQPVQMAALKTDTKESYISPEIEKQLNDEIKKQMGEQDKVVNESQQSNTVRENWITARKSFYQRNYELSEQKYQQVIDNTEDNFDAYGELGNVYFNQGKKTQAASAYFEAAAILVRKGQLRRAGSLMGLLRHLDEPKANELQQLIDSTSS